MNNPYRKLSKVNPQAENGHRRIENKLFKALIAAKLSGAEYQCVFLIIHESWGFQEKMVEMPIEYFVKINGLNPRNVRKIINRLEEKKMIYVNRSYKINSYGFNKHYDTWETKTPIMKLIKIILERINRGHQSPPSQKKQGALKPSVSPIINKKVLYIKKGIEKGLPDAVEKIIKRMEKQFNVSLSQEEATHFILGRNEHDAKSIERHTREFSNKLQTDIYWYNILAAALTELGFRIQSGKLKKWNGNLGFVFTGLFGNQANGKNTEPYLVHGIWEWTPASRNNFFKIEDVRTGKIEGMAYEI